MTGHTHTHYVYNSMHPECTGDIKLENTQSLQKVNFFGARAKILGNRESQINLQTIISATLPEL